MANSGELHGALGLPPPDRTPPQIHIGEAAVQMLRSAIADAGGDVVVRMDIDPQFRTRLHLAQPEANAVTSVVEGIRVEFDLAGARRADGLRIDWADDVRGKGLVIDNPNAPPPVRSITPADAIERMRAGTLKIVDVRVLDAERVQRAGGLRGKPALRRLRVALHEQDDTVAGEQGIDARAQGGVERHDGGIRGTAWGTQF